MRFWQRFRGQRPPQTQVDMSYTETEVDNYRPRFHMSIFHRMLRLTQSEALQQLRNSGHSIGLSYVPKCLGPLSASEVLQGNRPEDFASNCWLQGHLHQFGSQLSNLIPGDIDESDEMEENMDTLTGSDRFSDVNANNNSINSYNREGDDYSMYNPQLMRYIALNDLPQEPPPYSYHGDEYPPPSYEEAVAQAERRSNNSIRSSELAFMF